MGPLHGVLAGDHQLVVGRLLEVEEAHVPGWFAVLLDADAIGQERVGLLARLDEACELKPGDGAGGLLGVVLREPRVEPPKGLHQTAGEDRLLQRLALGFELLGGHVGEPQLLEQCDRRVLRQVDLIPVAACTPSRHEDAPSPSSRIGDPSAFKKWRSPASTSRKQ